MNEEVFVLSPGTIPLLVSLPHVGTHLPEEQKPRYVERALALEDTDWHLERLYDSVPGLGASLIVPKYSRYLIDLNRPPDNAPMYAGANNTELCPTHFFTGDPLYRDSMEPDADEINRRREQYWQPYHNAVTGELQRLKNQFGYALLFDGHSIRVELPWLFPGRLPDLNLGTADGRSCALSLRTLVAGRLKAQSDYSHVVDGRFKGGYITRHYGRPAESIHAVQMEMCQRLYMNESPPFDYRPDLAAKVQPLLTSILKNMLTWQPDE